jgi:hypothetical protein
MSLSLWVCSKNTPRPVRLALQQIVVAARAGSAASERGLAALTLQSFIVPMCGSWHSWCPFRCVAPSVCTTHKTMMLAESRHAHADAGMCHLWVQEVREAQEALLPPSMRAAARLLHAAGDVRAQATAGLEPGAWTQDGAATIVVAKFRCGPACRGDHRVPCAPRLHPCMQEAVKCLLSTYLVTALVHSCRFVHRPEWVSEGARLIIRDRSLG